MSNPVLARPELRSSGRLFLGLMLVFIAFLGVGRILQNPILRWTFVGASLLLCIGFIWVWFNRKSPLTFKVVIRKPHLVQSCVQFGVFVYWGSAWHQVSEQAPLILAQILFAYGCEAILSWRRFGHWRLGFGPIPVVLSTNLFLWFVDDFFGFQFAMILLAYLSRDLLCVHRDGKRTHLFNPSAFALGIAAIGLVVFRVPELTYGEQIAQTLGDPAYPYIWIFLMGFVVQGFFKVTLVTLSAALAMVFAGYAYTLGIGTYQYIDTSIPIAVFLGMNLLITDPATSPRTTLGRALFGILYGLLVFVAYDLLRHIELPSAITGLPINLSWSDKLLCVPFLNCLARPIDVLVARLEGYLRPNAWYTSNRVHMLFWLLVFVAIHPSLTAHPGAQVSFWEQACEKKIRRACADKNRLYVAQCDAGDMTACFNHGQSLQSESSESKNTAIALISYRRACLGGVVRGCFAVAQICQTDNTHCRTSEIDHALENACALSSEKGCVLFANRVLAEPINDERLQETVQSFGKGCALKAQPACAGLHTLGLGKLKLKTNEGYGFARQAFLAACSSGY